MSKFARKTVIAAKVEVTPGTDIIPAAADCIMVRNPVITPLDMTYEERNIVRGFFGNFDAIPTMKKVKVTFEVEYAGSGAAGTAPAWDGILQASGMSSTNVPATSQTWACLSGTGKTVSLYYNVDGLLHKMVWGRGNCTIKIKANGIPFKAYEFIGLDTGATDTVILTPASFGSYKTPLAANKLNTTITFFGVATLAVESFELNFGQKNEQVSRIGSEQILHTDRKATGSIMLEMTSVATKDWMASIKSGATGALSIVHGTPAGAGNILTLAAGQVQIQNPTFSEIQGIQMVQFQTRFNPTNAGNDEFTLVNT